MDQATARTASDLENRPILVRVAIPHFCRPQEVNGYGSTRSDARQLRVISLSRCLGSVLSLARSPQEQILDIAGRGITETPRLQSLSRFSGGLIVDCHLFVFGEHWLQSIVTGFRGQVTVHQASIKDPMHLVAAARDFLLKDSHAVTADLSVYLEDDLVIQDKYYVDKLLWFSLRTGHRFSLMPHRFEVTGDHRCPRFFVDGPIDQAIFPDHHRPFKDVANGIFWDGQKVFFDIASNPHSGTFAVTAKQIAQLQIAGLPSEGFIGPLETVATYTVLKKFPVFKPSWQCRDFLTVEHAHASFLGWRQQLPSSYSSSNS